MKKVLSLDIKYSLQQMFYYATFCSMMGYASVYLLAKDFTNSTIGIVLSVVSIIAVFTQPLIASFADNHKDIPLKTIVCYTLIVVIGLSVVMALLPVQGIFLLCFIVTIFSIMNTIMPLMNSLAFVFEEHGIEVNYGLARGLGSVAYAFASLLLGYIVKEAGANVLPYFYVLFSVILFAVVYVYVLPKQYAHNHVEVKKDDDVTNQLSFKDFCLKYKKFIALLAGFVLVYFAHTVINNFFIQIIREVNGNEADMGTAVFLAAMVELPTMAFFSKLSEKIDCGTLMKIAVVLFTVKHIVTYLASSVFMIYVAQVMQIGGYALFIPASVYYVRKKMHTADMNKGQSLVTTAMTLSGIFANFLGGFLLDGIGVHNVLLIGAILSAIGTIIVILNVEKVNA